MSKLSENSTGSLPDFDTRFTSCHLPFSGKLPKRNLKLGAKSDGFYRLTSNPNSSWKR